MIVLAAEIAIDNAAAIHAQVHPPVDAGVGLNERGTAILVRIIVDPHPGFAAVANKFPGKGLNTWEVNVMQDVKGKAFPLFSLVEGQTYVDYDLIYIYNDMLFNGSKNVDGRAFDKPENRPTNLQIPLVRQQ